MTKSYVGRTVNLPTTGTKYNLLAELLKLEPACPSAAAAYNIQLNSANLSATVYIGDGNVTASDCGYELKSGDNNGWSRSFQSLPFGAVHVIPSADNTKINVEVMTC